jgi:hydroxymethylbilane synthase
VKREDTRDVLIAKSPATILTLKRGASVATGSLRRRSQMLALRPDLRIEDIRGNLNTRFKKFDDSDLDAMTLAYAGVHRLKMDGRISEVISHNYILPAVGQGALAVETRAEDESVVSLVGFLNDKSTELTTKAERSLLRRLEGGCQIPIGAFAALENESLKLSAFIGSLDGRSTIRKSLVKFGVGSVRQAEAMGEELADELRRMGADKILEEIRRA